MLQFQLFGSRRAAAALWLAYILAGSAGAEYVAFDDVHTMPLGRSDMTVSPAQVGGELRMYVVGGCVSDQICYDPDSTMQCFCSGITNQTHYYRPSTNTYGTAADMPRERYRHAAAQVGGVIYLFGGRTLADDVITAVDAYDTATDTWTSPCSWDAAGSDNTAFTDGAKIWLAGGWAADYSSPISQVLEFDPATCEFVTKASLPTPRGDVSSITVGNRHFVMGGFTDGNFCEGSKVVESYTPASNSWTSHDDLTLGRADMAVGQIDGHVFAIAGETVNDKCSRSIPVPDVERLDAGDGGGGGGGGGGSTSAGYNGDWIIEQNVPSDRFRFVAASFGTSIFLFGGQGAWEDDLDGEGNGGFPIHNTAMLYTPKEYVDGTSIFDPKPNNEGKQDADADAAVLAAAAASGIFVAAAAAVAVASVF